MKKFTLTLLIAIVANTIQAQTWVKDSLVMGTGQNNDVFYHLGTGLVSTVNNQNWVLALSNQGGQKAGIYTNTRNSIVCYNPHLPVSAWSTIGLADTATSTLQYNQDSCWYTGSLNANANGTPFNYGWGSYVGAPTHNVVGDSIYIIKQGSNFIKLRIDSLGGFTRNWTLTVSALGLPTPDQTLTFNPNPKYTNSNFIYLNVVQAAAPIYFTLADTMREPANNTWDFVATKYTKQLTVPANFVQNYTGILSNGKITTAKIKPILLDVAATNYLTANYTSTINNIGADWKTFNLSLNKYEINDSTESYLIKSNDNAYYQIHFDSTSYAIGTTLIRFYKRKVGFPLAINDVTNLATAIGVYPNPTSDNVILQLDSKQNTNANLQLVDINGKTIFTKQLSITQGTNAWSIPTQQLASGNYIISINGNNIKASKQFTKQ